ncbi:BnaC01g00450D [Brassica napus]|uniref:BnaC01g00450D protein n=1 Tax=Brassica napus TaxID=3708 RepID=A0A078I0N3_BRANA|nr:BnaC01g00450D [Brassica napus]
MSSPVKKRKTIKKPSLKKNKETPPLVLGPTPESTPNPSLPDDLLLSCFARASRLYYPTLSLVSKSFASLFASPELYKTRSSLGRTESCLYVVSILDCRSNTWRDGPSMLVERDYPHANVIDGKIYVAGDSNSTSPDNGLAYDTREGRWESADMEMDSEWVWYSYCVVENVIYVYNNEEFKWYDSTVRLWKVLKGLKGLPKFPRYTARLADFGGKMAVLWGRGVASSGYVDKIIWCAVIALERRSDQEIWGKVEWKEPVLKVPKSCSIDHALAATV